MLVCIMDDITFSSLLANVAINISASALKKYIGLILAHQVGSFSDIHARKGKYIK